MARRNDRDSRGAIQMCPAFALVIDYEFENSMSVRCTECNGIFPRIACNRVERSADVGIQHREFELQVFAAGARDPVTFLWIEFREVDAVYELVVDGILLTGLRCIYFVVLDFVDTKYKAFLESPCDEVTSKLSVA